MTAIQHRLRLQMVHIQRQHRHSSSKKELLAIQTLWQLQLIQEIKQVQW